MEVLEVDEQPDGSALLKLELEADEVQFLLEYAIISILKQQIELGKRKEEEND